MTTVVSLGLSNPRGVAVDGSGNIYIADSLNNAIEEWNALTQQLNTLVSAGLNNPGGVAVDGSGNLYIADSLNNAIKQWSPATQQLTTLVSTGLNNPGGVAVDFLGNVYIADSLNNAVEEWNASTQQLNTLVSAGLNNPGGVAVDGSGNVYIADSLNNVIKEWSPVTQQVALLIPAGLSNPAGVAVDDAGNVYVGDSLNNAIEEMPYVFVGPANLTESTSEGSGVLLQVLPVTAPLTGSFAPVSDQAWLTIGSVANGIINFSFSANNSPSARTAHITVLGQLNHGDPERLCGTNDKLRPTGKPSIWSRAIHCECHSQFWFAGNLCLDHTFAVCTLSIATVTRWSNWASAPARFRPHKPVTQTIPPQHRSTKAFK